jgi:UDP-N-acetylglucosamine 2-epimerase (non-hydrolysing)
MAKRVLFVFGTRPEAIKMAPVIELAKQRRNRLEPLVCVTGQHRYFLDQALAEFNIKPDIDLNLMMPGQTLYDIISRVSQRMKDVYRRVCPDLVLVQGDTSTVFAAALACYYEGIDVGHIEAGLRSGDNHNPFPEEINRRFVSLVARYNFCPTATAKKNLLSEGVNPKKIFVTGNTVIDIIEKTLQEMKLKQPVISGVAPEFLQVPFVLITGHRRENFNGGVENICTTVKSLAGRYPGFHWLWAVHLNPNAREIVFKTLNGLANVRIIEAPAYREFIYLMSRCKFVISDSGGIQEEVPSLGKKVLVTRICTERPEAVKSGTSILVGTDPDKISKHADSLLKDTTCGNNTKNPFGDGMVSRRIVDVIVEGSCREFSPD